MSSNTLSFAGPSSVASSVVRGARAARPTAAPLVTEPVRKSWSLWQTLDGASLWFSNAMTTWATSGLTLP